VQQFRVALAALATMGFGAPGPPTDARSSNAERDGVRLVAAWFAGPVRRAVRGASRRLALPACAAILDEFEDGAGRPLRESLEEISLDAPSYARQVLFYDGTNETPCRRNPRLHAYTVPGSRVVRACPSLAALARADPGRAEAVVIHEVLHTLGLGEDPPSSREITARVESRCGR
jgi:hypothetical protein